jgi:hypothetical protein
MERHEERGPRCAECTAVEAFAAEIAADGELDLSGGKVPDTQPILGVSHGGANVWTSAAVKPFARRESDWLALFALCGTEREHGYDRR